MIRSYFKASLFLALVATIFSIDARFSSGVLEFLALVARCFSFVACFSSGVLAALVARVFSFVACAEIIGGFEVEWELE